MPLSIFEDEYTRVYTSNLPLHCFFCNSCLQYLALDSMRGDLDGSVNLQFHYSVCAYVSSIFNLESTIIQHLALPKSTFVFITAVSARPEGFTTYGRARRSQFSKDSAPGPGRCLPAQRSISAEYQHLGKGAFIQLDASAAHRAALWKKHGSRGHDGLSKKFATSIMIMQ